MHHLLTRSLLGTLLAVTVSAPAFAQMRTSEPAPSSSGGNAPRSTSMRTSADTAGAAGDASVAAHAGTILSDSGIIFAPRYLPAGNLEGGVALGLANGSTFSQPLPLAALTGGFSDGLDWGVLLSAESQFGLRQRYASSDSWSWGGSYLGRVNFLPGVAGAAPTLDSYGLTYRNELMLTMNGLDLYAQPEVSYYLGTTAGPQAALAIGADYWLMPQFSLGVSGQGIGYFGNQPFGAFETRVSGGAKYFPTDDLWVFANDTYLNTRGWNAALAGVGYRWR